MTQALSNLEACDSYCAEEYLKHYTEVVPFIKNLKFTSQFDFIRKDLETEKRRCLKRYREQFGAEWDVSLSLIVAMADRSGDVEIDLASFSVGCFGHRSHALYFVGHLKRSLPFSTINELTLSIHLSQSSRAMATHFPNLLQDISRHVLEYAIQVNEHSVWGGHQYDCCAVIPLVTPNGSRLGAV